MSKDKKDDLVILPSGDFVKWNDWTPTEAGPHTPPPSIPPTTPEHQAMMDFFLPRGPEPEPHTLAAEYKREGRCPQCGELGRMHMSMMCCSKHGPYT